MKKPKETFLKNPDSPEITPLSEIFPTAFKTICRYIIGTNSFADTNMSILEKINVADAVDTDDSGLPETATAAA